MLQGWKTLIGIAITGIATIAKLMGHDIGDTAELETSALATFETIAQFVGLVIATYGRFVAVTPVGGN